MPTFVVPNSFGALRESSQADLRKRYGIEQFEYPTPTSTIKHIGFAPKDQKWYGWSHRAIYGFGIGSRVTKGSVIADGIAADLRSGGPGPFPVGFVAKTLDDARRMASQFAIEVS